MSTKRRSRLPLRSPSRPTGLAGGAGLVAVLALFLPLGPSGSAPGGSGGQVELRLAGASVPASFAVTWSNAQPANGPPPLRGAAAAYDGDTSSLVLFGGVTADGSLSNNTWVWDGRTWTLHPASAMTQAPPARQQAAMAFDPGLHQLILFGGEASDGSVLGDTWAWNGASWYQLTPGPSGSPGARRAASLAYDANGDLVLFGGIGSPPAASTVPATTTTTSTTTPAASPTNGPISGGTGGAASTPGPSTPAAPPPTVAATTGQAVAASAASAGTLLADTWLWTSQGWTPSSASGPAPRWGAALAYDSTNHTTVLYSGNTAAPGSPARAGSDTWTWNGSRWTAARPGSSPPGRFDAVMTDDPPGGGVLLTAGNNGSGVLSDSWVWTGSDWNEASSTGATARSEAAAAYDSTRSELVVFGGAGGGGGSLSDTELLTTAVKVSDTPTTKPTTVATTGPTSSTTSRSTSSTTRPATSATTSRATPTGTTTAPKGSPTPGSSLSPGSPSPFMSLQTSLHNVRSGAPIHLAGSGFEPGATITITFHSTPALVGRTLAGPQGDFAATVSVPSSAAPGEHHFVATGVAPDGRITELVAAVVVLGPPGQKTTPFEVKAAMVGLALLIPAGAWFGMTTLGWWRRRSTPAP